MSERYSEKSVQSITEEQKADFLRAIGAVETQDAQRQNRCCVETRVSFLSPAERAEHEEFERRERETRSYVFAALVFVFFASTLYYFVGLLAAVAIAAPAAVMITAMAEAARL